MTISVGDTLPDATVYEMTPEGPKEVSFGAEIAGKKVAFFGLPGAFTGTCTSAHLPSFISVMDQLKEKGVEAVICLSVNDPFVMGAWSDSTGAGEAGIKMYGDASGALTKALGLDFDAPPAGLFGRSKRYAAYAEDGVLKVLQVEDGPGNCTVSAGGALLDAI